MTTTLASGTGAVRLASHRYAAVHGRRVFCREADDPSLPAIVLLHGLPTRSQMFRGLIPALSDRFHLIAPDHIGFGHSDAPADTEFEYAFDNLSAHVAGCSTCSGCNPTFSTCRTAAARSASACSRSGPIG